MQDRYVGLGLALFTLTTAGTMLVLAQPAGQPAGQVQGKGDDDAEKDDGEEVITLDKAPAAVRAAAVKLAGDAANITKVVKEEDDEDRVRYEVEFKDGATECAAVFSTAGELMETEKATTEAKLPAAVMAAIRRAYPKAVFANPFVVTKVFYEIEVVVDGKKHEVKVDASGDIEDEAKDGDNEKDEERESEKGGKEENGEDNDD